MYLDTMRYCNDTHDIDDLYYQRFESNENCERTIGITLRLKMNACVHLLLKSIKSIFTAYIILYFLKKINTIYFCDRRIAVFSILKLSKNFIYHLLRIYDLWYNNIVVCLSHFLKLWCQSHNIIILCLGSSRGNVLFC